MHRYRVSRIWFFCFFQGLGWYLFLFLGVFAAYLGFYSVFFLASSTLLYFVIFRIRVLFILSDLRVIFTSASWLLAKNCITRDNTGTPCTRKMETGKSTAP
ncbi:hypothetical protein HOY80DRAFT_50562 [Tuber brumale]|nr:hypothetical protein HOY80DRAFT_50562 [Tuber brumale]